MQNYYNAPQAQQYAAPYPQPDENFIKEMNKNTQRRSLRKASNGLGWMVLVYYLSMQTIYIIFTIIGKLFNVYSRNTANEFDFYLQIISAVGSSLVAGLFYLLISKRRPSYYLTDSKLTFSKLFPMIMLGMGASMLANVMAGIFDNNISLFQLENSVSQTMEASSVPEMLLYIVSVAVIPAFAEEFAFRGIFMSVMRKFGDSFAIITSALLFGAMHGNTTQIVFAFVLGLIFAFVDCKANSIIPSIIIHFTNNFYAVVMDLLQNNTGLDENTVNIINAAIVLLFCVLGILSFIFLLKSDKSFFSVSNKDENRFSDNDSLTFKEKISTFLKSPVIIVALCIFALEMILFLLPKDIYNSLLGI